MMLVAKDVCPYTKDTLLKKISEGLIKLCLSNGFFFLFFFFLHGHSSFLSNFLFKSIYCGYSFELH